MTWNEKAFSDNSGDIIRDTYKNSRVLTLD